MKFSLLTYANAKIHEEVLLADFSQLPYVSIASAALLTANYPD